MTAPIIVSGLFGNADFKWLDAQRKAYFPIDRNRLQAHLTLFHHLPPSVGSELRQRLREACMVPSPVARLAGLISLDGGVAYRVDSPELCAIRAELANMLAGLLIPQDQAVWRPHVTIQNKVKPNEARALIRKLGPDFRPRPLEIAGLAAWFYRSGPWEWIAGYRFGNGRPIRAIPG